MMQPSRTKKSRKDNGIATVSISIVAPDIREYDVVGIERQNRQTATCQIVASPLYMGNLKSMH